jgi:hypothetical protein
MRAPTASEIRTSFVNSSRSKVASMTLPGLDDLDWDALDFLGWRDAKAPLRSYLVTEHGSGLVGVELRAPGTPPSAAGRKLCNVCHTTHHGDAVFLYVAPRAGAAGKAGNTVGTYLCADLQCSRYARGLLKNDLPQGNTPPDERIPGLPERLAQFRDQVLEP